ncbi:MAG TPA: EF-P lysine aminoacylase EpmA [Gammaproteobacteria bacterium]|nr:EF-P lysine aminoacylase EpmA [Gammaproteobacteria bacterium]
MSPAADLRERLRVRASVLAAIREFFAARDVIEVDTPALSAAAVTDPALASLSTPVRSLGGRRYLQTSPEFAMKRLLAAGSGDIFQIARVYRDAELGRWHQPEFLLLEWYRTGFDERALIDEVFALLGIVLEPRFSPLARLDLSYREAFESAFDVDPLELDADGCRALARALAERNVDAPASLGPDALLDLAVGTALTADWPRDTAVFLYDYPASQAALAAVKPTAPPVAARFEVFVNGLELGNGFRELTDAALQRRRFEADLEARREVGLPAPPIDAELLAALEAGLPECAGVAVGLDRLIGLLMGADSLAEAVSFPHVGSDPFQVSPGKPGET